MTGAELRMAMNAIRNDLKCGYLSYDEAKERASYFICGRFKQSLVG